MIVDWTLPAIEDLDSIQEFIATDRESFDDAYSFIYIQRFYETRGNLF